MPNELTLKHQANELKEAIISELKDNENIIKKIVCDDGDSEITDEYILNEYIRPLNNQQLLKIFENDSSAVIDKFKELHGREPTYSELKLQDGYDNLSRSIYLSISDLAYKDLSQIYDRFMDKMEDVYHEIMDESRSKIQENTTKFLDEISKEYN